MDNRRRIVRRSSAFKNPGSRPFKKPRKSISSSSFVPNAKPLKGAKQTKFIHSEDDTAATMFMLAGSTSRHVTVPAKLLSAARLKMSQSCVSFQDNNALQGMGKLPARELLEVEAPSRNLINSVACTKGIRKYVEESMQAKKHQDKLLEARRSKHQTQVLDLRNDVNIQETNQNKQALLHHASLSIAHPLANHSNLNISEKRVSLRELHQMEQMQLLLRTGESQRESQSSISCVEENASSVTSMNAINFTFPSKVDTNQKVKWQDFHQMLENKLKSLRSYSKMPSLAWVRNHYRWVIWKLASMERRFPYICGGFGNEDDPEECEFARWLTISRTQEQLLWRWKREYGGERSSLRKIYEGDASPLQYMVLAVAQVTKIVSPGSGSGSCENERFQLELTDGWYGIRCQLDSDLTSRCQRSQIRVGMKLCIQNAILRTGSRCFNGMSPLDAPCNSLDIETHEHPCQSPCLVLSANSTRPAKWDAKLGFQASKWFNMGSTVNLSVSGGVVGQLKLVIARVFPTQYVERLQTGDSTRLIFRDAIAEDIAAEQHRIRMETLLKEKVISGMSSNDVMAEWPKRDVSPLVRIAVLDFCKTGKDGVVSELTIWNMSDGQRFDELEEGAVIVATGLSSRQPSRNLTDKTFPQVQLHSLPCTEGQTSVEATTIQIKPSPISLSASQKKCSWKVILKRKKINRKVGIKGSRVGSTKNRQAPPQHAHNELFCEDTRTNILEENCTSITDELNRMQRIRAVGYTSRESFCLEDIRGKERGELVDLVVVVVDPPTLRASSTIPSLSSSVIIDEAALFVTDFSGYVGAILLPRYDGNEGNMIVTSVLRSGGSRIGCPLSLHNLRYEGFDSVAKIIRFVWVPEQTCIGRRGLLRASIVKVKHQCNELGIWAKSLEGRCVLEAARSNVEALRNGNLPPDHATSLLTGSTDINIDGVTIYGSILAIGKDNSTSGRIALRVALTDGSIAHIEMGEPLVDKKGAKKLTSIMPSALLHSVFELLKSNTDSNSKRCSNWSWISATDTLLELRIVVQASAKGKLSKRKRVAKTASYPPLSPNLPGPSVASPRVTRSSVKKRKLIEAAAAAAAAAAASALSKEYSHSKEGLHKFIKAESILERKVMKLRRSNRKRVKPTDHSSIIAPEVSSPSASQPISSQGRHLESSSLPKKSLKMDGRECADISCENRGWWIGSSVKVLPSRGLSPVSKYELQSCQHKSAHRDVVSKPLELRIQSSSIKLVKKELKLWEGCVNKGRFRHARIGDILKLKGIGDTNETTSGNKLVSSEDQPGVVNVVVQEIRRFATFRAMISSCGVHAFLPGVSIEDAVESYQRTLVDSSEIKANGLIAFRFRMMVTPTK